MAEEKLKTHVQRYANKRSLQAILSNFVLHKHVLFDTLPQDNYKCRDEVTEAMECYFKWKNEEFNPSDSLEVEKHAFMDYVTENACHGSLRENFSNYIRVERGTFPKNNSNCRKLVETVMEMYFEIKKDNFVQK